MRLFGLALPACLCIALAVGLSADAATSLTGPSFAAARQYTASEDADGVAIGDLDGDGKPDLAIANSFGEDLGDLGTVSVRFNRGDGTFRPGATTKRHPARFRSRWATSTAMGGPTSRPATRALGSA